MYLFRYMHIYNYKNFYIYMRAMMYTYVFFYVCVIVSFNISIRGYWLRDILYLNWYVSVGMSLCEEWENDLMNDMQR